MAKPMLHCLVVTAIGLALSGTASARYKFFDSDGVRIRYLDQGVGEAVVLIHGNTSRIEHNWVETGVFDALSVSHRVIALDVRGFGESDKPHDPAAYGTQMGDDVIRLLDHLEIDRAHVMGYSMGAGLTSWLVVNHPDRLISAILGASTYTVDSPQRRRNREETAKAWEIGKPEDGNLPLTVEGVKEGNPGIGDAEAAAFVVERTSTNDPLAMAAVARGRYAWSIRDEELSETQVPILHVYGSLETPGRLAAAERLKTIVLPRVESVVLKNATHSGHTALYRHPEFLEVVSDFLERHRLAP
jgi:pimeloyl-ACP methyl ester carboxylesterase